MCIAHLKSFLKASSSLARAAVSACDSGGQRKAAMACDSCASASECGCESSGSEQSLTGVRDAEDAFADEADGGNATKSLACFALVTVKIDPTATLLKQTLTSNPAPAHLLQKNTAGTKCTRTTLALPQQEPSPQQPYSRAKHTRSFHRQRSTGSTHVLALLQQQRGHARDGSGTQ